MPSDFRALQPLYLGRPWSGKPYSGVLQLSCPLQRPQAAGTLTISAPTGCLSNLEYFPSVRELDLTGQILPPGGLRLICGGFGWLEGMRPPLQAPQQLLPRLAMHPSMTPAQGTRTTPGVAEQAYIEPAHGSKRRDCTPPTQPSCACGSAKGLCAGTSH